MAIWKTLLAACAGILSTGLLCINIQAGRPHGELTAGLRGAVAGFGLLLAIWVIGQDFGQIYSGQATDPNTGVIAIVATVGLLPLRRRRARRDFDEGAC